MGNPYIPPEVMDTFWSWLRRKFSPSAIPETLYGPTGANVQRQTLIPTAYNAAPADVMPARPVNPMARTVPGPSVGAATPAQFLQTPEQVETQSMHEAGKQSFGMLPTMVESM